VENLYRVLLGKNGAHAKRCFTGGFVGADFGIHQDLTARLPEEKRTFNKTFVPIFLKKQPNQSRRAAGLACSQLWTISKGFASGDLLLCPYAGYYRIGEVIGAYTYEPRRILPHRRPVRWHLDVEGFRLETRNYRSDEDPEPVPSALEILEDDLSERLRRSCDSDKTVVTIGSHRKEIKRLLRLRDTPTYPGAQTELGQLHKSGDARGIPKNYAEAVRLFRLAAKAGHKEGYYALGLMYANGNGVPQDDVRAHMWFNLCAAKEPGMGQQNPVEQRMTRDQIADAQELARKWHEARPVESCHSHVPGQTDEPRVLGEREHWLTNIIDRVGSPPTRTQSP
jgi:TPR repeat protein